MKIRHRTDPTMRSASECKRIRLSPSVVPNVSVALVPSSLPPLPPLKNVTGSKLMSPRAPLATSNDSRRKLAELRCKYLDDIIMVIQELKSVLTYGPGSACRDSPVPPSTVLKLVRTVQTLEKLRALLLMKPSRLRRVSSDQVKIVEDQIKMNLLPIATLFRSFDSKEPTGIQQRSTLFFLDSAPKMEEGWNEHCSTKPPHSPSEVSATATPRYDWRFLSMALSLQL